MLRKQRTDVLVQTARKPKDILHPRLDASPTQPLATGKISQHPLMPAPSACFLSRAFFGRMTRLAWRVTTGRLVRASAIKSYPHLQVRHTKPQSFVLAAILFGATFGNL